MIQFTIIPFTETGGNSRSLNSSHHFDQLDPAHCVPRWSGTAFIEKLRGWLLLVWNNVLSAQFISSSVLAETHFRAIESVFILWVVPNRFTNKLKITLTVFNIACEVNFSERTWICPGKFFCLFFLICVKFYL